MDEEAAEVDVDDDVTATMTAWDLPEERHRLNARKRFG